ncbi:MAG: hypothetical protein ATN31_03200 [Candidatus Epulonipiscioides saccharophilum]|nr:MAG: hypothetical protein ATN31_03200 [Epulopiscium sp. AS2M-Bin001]
MQNYSENVNLALENSNAIIIIGAGGHAGVINDIIKMDGRYTVAGVIDSRLKAGDPWKPGIHCLGDDSALEDIFKSGITNAVIGIGEGKNLRFTLYQKLKKIGFNFPTLIHPSAIISDDQVNIGEGSVIMPSVVINCCTNIGKLAIINTGVIIEHNCSIGYNVHVAPTACILGGVYIGNFVHIGAKAVILQNCTVGDRAIIGLGAIVIRNVLNGLTVVGVPAKPI